MKLWLIYLLPITLVIALSGPSSLLYPPSKFYFRATRAGGVEQRSRDGALKEMQNTMGTVRN